MRVDDKDQESLFGNFTKRLGSTDSKGGGEGLGFATDITVIINMPFRVVKG